MRLISFLIKNRDESHICSSSGICRTEAVGNGILQPVVLNAIGTFIAKGKEERGGGSLSDKDNCNGILCNTGEERLMKMHDL